jgi:hypothetical protein
MHSRRIPKARHCLYLAVLIIPFLASACGSNPSPNINSNPPPPVILAPVTSTTSIAPDACSQSDLYAVTFVNAAGTPTADLVTCTNRDRSETTIENTSEDTVWLIDRPLLSYWTLADDQNESPTVQLFRAGLRTALAASGGQIYRTVEPGTTASVSSPPDQVALNQNPGEQSAWQVAALMVTTIKDKAQEQIVDVLGGGSDSPGRAAIVSCVADGYSLGKSLSEEQTDPAENLQTLSEEVDDVKDGKDCAEKINAYDESKPVPALSVGDLEKTEPNDLDWNRTGQLDEDAERAVQDFHIGHL